MTQDDLTEPQFQDQITGLAQLLGWWWCHWRPAQTTHGWRTPVSGPLGAGWPDLFLARERDQRVMLVELKAGRGQLSDAQAWVHDRLRGAGLEVHVWRPGDIDAAAAALR